MTSTVLGLRRLASRRLLSATGSVKLACLFGQSESNVGRDLPSVVSEPPLRVPQPP